MQIRNPCKICIVKSMCCIRCPARQDFWDTRAKFFDYLGKFGVGASIVVILVTSFIY